MRHTEQQQQEWSKFQEKLPTLNDEQLQKECENYIWLSAYAANNPRSNYHRMCDACYDECKKRDKVNIYEKAYKHVSGE